MGEYYDLLKSGKMMAKSVQIDAYTKAEADVKFATKSEIVGKTATEGSTIINEDVVFTVGTNAEIFNDYTINKVAGNYTHAEGSGTTALSDYSHAEGYRTLARGEAAHAEGIYSAARSVYSHAEGNGTTASGSASHAEGNGTTASGTASHAEGYGTAASNYYSHAEGNCTVAASANQHAQGKFNVEDSNDTFAFIIGNGTDGTHRSNALSVDWDGKIYTHNSATGFDIQSNYIEFPNGQRLYNSTTPPTGDIPDGSIGVGW